MELKIEEIHEDTRGAIFKFDLDKNEILLIFTKAGCSRGGHTHREQEQIFVLSGSLTWSNFISDHEEIKELYQGDLVIIPSLAPHTMTANTDCWVVDTKTNMETEDAINTMKCWREYVGKKLLEQVE